MIYNKTVDLIERGSVLPIMILSLLEGYSSTIDIDDRDA